MEYKIVYSKRKSIAIQVTPDGEVLVKAPKNTPKKNIEETVKKYSDWIEKTQKKVLGKDIGMKKASAEEEKLLRKKARELLRMEKMTVPEVADAVGFSDYNYFLRVFRKEYGMSPRRFAKSCDEE